MHEEAKVAIPFGAYRAVVFPNSKSSSSVRGRSSYLWIPQRMLIVSSSTTLKNAIDVEHIRLVIDDNGIDFDPRVGYERQNLNANHHFCGPPMPPEHDRCCRRALQAQNLSEIKCAREVDCPAHKAMIDWSCPSRTTHGSYLYAVSDGRKSSQASDDFEIEQ
jgi:hypothetical protein